MGSSSRDYDCEIYSTGEENGKQLIFLSHDHSQNSQMHFENDGKSYYQYHGKWGKFLSFFRDRIFVRQKWLQIVGLSSFLLLFVVIVIFLLIRHDTEPTNNTSKLESFQKLVMELIDLKFEALRSDVKNQLESGPENNFLRLDIENINGSFDRLWEAVKTAENRFNEQIESVQDAWNTEKHFLNLSHLTLKQSFEAHIELEKQSCGDIQRLKKGSNLTVDFPKLSLQTIYPFASKGNDKAVQVLCDFETDEGGWTIIQRRNSGPQDQFYRNWTDYEQGFSSPDKINGSYWIGLKAIRALTSARQQTLRIELTDWDGSSRYAEYKQFSISGPLDKYRLEVKEYSGNASDSLTYHNGMKFSTLDQDNDETYINCAVDRHSGWWFKSCSESNLNGYYWEESQASRIPVGDGVAWYGWKGNQYSMKSVQMKIRHEDTKIE